MSRKNKLNPIVLVTVSIALCFSVLAFFYISLLDKYRLLSQQNNSTSVVSTGAASFPSPTFSPSPSPSLPANQSEMDLLQQQLAAAQTGELVREIKDSSNLEDKTTYVTASEKKFVYLTFDDGPSKYTPDVLEILKENNIKATFFVQYSPDKDYYREIAEGGHTLALHSYTHDYAKIYAGEKPFFDDLNLISSYVKSITGIDSKIVRLAGGSSNTISRNYSKGVMTRIAVDLESQGYVYFDWNAQCMDATTRGISPSSIMKNVQSFTYINGIPKPFIILLLHNGINEQTTVEALQSIIDYYRDLGYTFRQITMETPAVHQPLQN